jgi:hypothetical protein
MLDLRDRRPAIPPELKPRPSRAKDKRVQRRRRHVAAARRKLETLVGSGGSPEDDDFDGPIWKRCRTAFLQAQHDKCAYCESRIPHVYPGDVEHYRPKTAVRRVRETKKGTFAREAQSRPGYWWLAYSFENFLVSCFWCNNAKGTQFPVR